MPTLEIRDQTNILCLAGYLNLFTGTFPAVEEGRGSNNNLGFAFKMGDRRKQHMVLWKKVECGWESLVCNWFWLKFSLTYLSQEIFCNFLKHTPHTHTPPSHYRLNEQCEHLPFTCTARGFWHVKSLDTLAKLCVWVECARMQTAAIRIWFRGIFKRILAWPSSGESGKCQKYNCNDNLVFFLLKTAAKAT